MTRHLNAVSKSNSTRRLAGDAPQTPSMAATEPVGIVGWTEILVFFASLFSKFTPLI